MLLTFSKVSAFAVASLILTAPLVTPANGQKMYSHAAIEPSKPVATRQDARERIGQPRQQSATPLTDTAVVYEKVTRSKVCEQIPEDIGLCHWSDRTWEQLNHMIPEWGDARVESIISTLSRGIRDTNSDIQRLEAERRSWLSKADEYKDDADRYDDDKEYEQAIQARRRADNAERKADYLEFRQLGMKSAADLMERIRRFLGTQLKSHLAQP